MGRIETQIRMGEQSCDMESPFEIARDPPTLLTLPHEIQDMIFAFAYTSGHPVRILSPGEWSARDHSGYFYPYETAAPMPDSRMTEMVVSKEFFVSAAAAYLKHTRVDTARSTKSSINHLMAKGMWAMGLHTVEMNLNLVIHLLSHFSPPIKNLTIFMWNARGNDFGTKNECGWDEDLDESDFRRMKGVEKITQFRGLSQLHVVARSFTGSLTHHESVRWKDNVARFEKFLRASVYQPPGPEPALLDCDDQQRPLYPGSRVRAMPLTSLLPDPDAGFDEGSPEPDLSGSEMDDFLAPQMLTDAEVPSTEQELWLLMGSNAAGVVAWMQNAKQRIQCLDRE